MGLNEVTVIFLFLIIKWVYHVSYIVLKHRLCVRTIHVLSKHKKNVNYSTESGRFHSHYNSQYILYRSVIIMYFRDRWTSVNAEGSAYVFAAYLIPEDFYENWFQKLR